MKIRFGLFLVLLGAFVVNTMAMRPVGTIIGEGEPVFGYNGGGIWVVGCDACSSDLCVIELGP